jgi:hypothetical protein
MTGRVTLKQALREYPGDVRSAAWRVRDEWRKLTAPTYPRLRLPERLTDKDLASRSPEERRAREQCARRRRLFLWSCLAWFLVQLLVCAAVFFSPATSDPARAMRGLAVICVLSMLIVFEFVYLAYASHSLATYGEWVTVPPKP